MFRRSGPKPREQRSDTDAKFYSKVVHSSGAPPIEMDGKRPDDAEWARQVDELLGRVSLDTVVEPVPETPTDS